MAERGFISALVLAAGRGSRMGRTKQLLPLDGEPVLARVIDASLASGADEVVVVLGHAAGEIRDTLGTVDDRVRFVVNPEYERGQSTSLIAGLDALDPRSAAAVVLLGDQPAVTAADVDSVVAGFLAADALGARATYDSGAAGHPTVLGRDLWGEIRGERGDVGAREVLRRHGERVATVRLNKAPPADLDTPDDYRSLLHASERRGRSGG
jgi:molybdenum cofactor cytidylyltransferase